MTKIDFLRYSFKIVLLMLTMISCDKDDKVAIYSSLEECSVTDVLGNCCNSENLDCNGICFGLSECELSSYGCTQPESVNYNPDATIDDGNCVNDISPAGWKLVWNDEFNGTELDLSKWNRETGIFVNNEEQTYTDSEFNSFLNNGFLHIVGQQESNSDTLYTSGRINTSGKASFRYGRFEAFAKLPESSGSWPAFWMLSESIYSLGWPSSGEIDIMEYVSNDPNKIHSSIHCDEYNWTNETNSVSNTNSVSLSSVTSDFNLYIAEWTEDKITFKVNDITIHTFENDGLNNYSTWPFNTDFFLILNLAIGGDWVEGIDGIIEDDYYDKFIIDYVRVYELDE